eukprot:NODE_2556_length_903_cov_45.306792_g2100_i0.p1 GENE.NODE_2556_length_903_cov_45.306792_g2100_i0~~NODE_2556_length_903_cov_45.306792_g2100_i0.p1  ORF type:complete len:125 (+),score=31.02 NODE_2556_length_903_cov_45.306792_g2100_i0:442-816(+)
MQTVMTVRKVFGLKGKHAKAYEGNAAFSWKGDTSNLLLVSADCDKNRTVISNEHTQIATLVRAGHTYSLEDIALGHPRARILSIAVALVWLFDSDSMMYDSECVLQSFPPPPIRFAFRRRSSHS